MAIIASEFIYNCQAKNNKIALSFLPKQTTHGILFFPAHTSMNLFFGRYIIVYICNFTSQLTLCIHEFLSFLRTQRVRGGEGVVMSAPFLTFSNNMQVCWLLVTMPRGQKRQHCSLQPSSMEVCHLSLYNPPLFFMCDNIGNNMVSALPSFYIP